MLKWLVTKGPTGTPTDGSEAREKVITDDPLATINRRAKRNDPIYAVSRVNPIFEEDDSKDQTGEAKDAETEEQETEEKHPESPPTDRESVRSSGYGSKEADSVSYKSDSLEEDEYNEFKEEENPSKTETKAASSSVVSEETRYNQRQRNVAQVKNSEEGESENTEDRNVSLILKSPGSVAELRKSFELISTKKLNTRVKIIEKDQNFVGCIAIGNQRPPHSTLEIIPEVSESAENSPNKASWPRVSHLAQALQRQADRIHQRRERERLKDEAVKNQSLRFNPLVSVVTQNAEYVTGISVSPKQKDSIDSSESKNFSNSASNFILEPKIRQGNEHSVPEYFKKNVASPTTDFSLLSVQPDSLINDDTLRMMNYPDMKFQVPITSQNQNQLSPRDMPDFGRAIFSNFSNRSRSNSSSGSQDSLAKPRRSCLSNSSNSIKKKGLDTVKDLWEKTGLKTNGRKLMVDINDLISTENRKNVLSRAASYDSVEDRYRSIPATFGNSSSQYRLPSNKSSGSSSGMRSSQTYEDISAIHRPLSSGSFTEVSEKGYDNFGFVDDRRDSASIQSKSSFQFQHNLTDFQRMVSEKMQSEESSHRKTWLDVEKGLQPSSSSRNAEVNSSDKLMPKVKDKFNSKRSNKSLPGQAVREFGLLDGNDDYHKTWNKNQKPFNIFGNKNRQQYWDTFNSRYGDRSLSGIFSLHPNSEAPMCGNGGPCQDFTIDARKSERNMLKSNKSARRKKCCAVFIVFFAFFFFIVTIITVSWFYTGGQRIFGPM